jgi:hypothetical protein
MQAEHVPNPSELESIKLSTATSDRIAMTID